MSRKHATSWEIDDLDPSWDASPTLRPKPIVRRVPARWDEREGALVATIDGWSVRVDRLDPSSGWEWSAFSLAAPRALRSTGFADREAAQRDVEGTLAALT